jgi:NAD(P)-dependent dehydrogenase (short-subunit alcohol dehydrogenase family)
MEVTMPRRLQDAVVVITGASSGIGRATALRMAQRGATVVVAARREEPLQEVAEECEREGAQSLAVPTDVTSEEAVAALARTAMERFGRIDVWINNAAVSLFARFEDAPPEAFRRVIETNLFGYVYGARAVLRYFRQRGRGVLINNASVYGVVGAPYLSAYITTKFAVRGLSECVRLELRDTPGIHVCTILPASIDTPIFQHAANYTGRAIKPLRPVYPAEKVADAMVQCAMYPRREVIVGNAGRGMALLHALAPPVYERLSVRQVETDHFQHRAVPHSPGNLFQPMDEGTGVSGGWRTSSHWQGKAVLGYGFATLAMLGWWAWGSSRGSTAQKRDAGVSVAETRWRTG